MFKHSHDTTGNVLHGHKYIRVLRRILGPKTDEVTGDWRKLHNKELHNCTPRQT
jgi:hypothetical protein